MERGGKNVEMKRGVREEMEQVVKGGEGGKREKGLESRISLHMRDSSPHITLAVSPPPEAVLPAPRSPIPAPRSLLPAPHSLLPAPCSLLPAPCSLLPPAHLARNMASLALACAAFICSLCHCPLLLSSLASALLPAR